MHIVAQELLVGFDEEMKSTRKTLERVPMEKPEWKPHEKSMAIARLAAHVATLPRFAIAAIQKDSFDVATEFKMPGFKTADDLVAAFDALVTEARETIADATDEQLAQPWSFTAGGKNIFTWPRAYVIRVFMMNHLIHHRAQLGVYLRLNEIPVPAVYGPSADEKIM